jgi:hypothetical protein
MTTEPQPDEGNVKRRLSRLTAERTTLFAQAGTVSGLSKDDHTRLSSLERRIDECFLEIRRERAAREARRFTVEGQVVRRGLRPRPDARA